MIKVVEGAVHLEGNRIGLIFELNALLNFLIDEEPEIMCSAIYAHEKELGHAIESCDPNLLKISEALTKDALAHMQEVDNNEESDS